MSHGKRNLILLTETFFRNKKLRTEKKGNANIDLSSISALLERIFFLEFLIGGDSFSQRFQTVDDPNSLLKQSHSRTLTFQIR